MTDVPQPQSVRKQPSMIARVRTILLTPDRHGPTIEMIQDTELPGMRAAPGFAGMIVLGSTADAANAPNGERIEVVSLWQNPQSLEAYSAVEQSAAPPEGQERDFDVSLTAGMAGGVVARFVTVEPLPGHIDTVVTLFENVVMHAATEQRGFRRGLLLIDRPGNRAVSIGLWQSEADMIASAQVGYLSQQVGNFVPIVATPIVPETMIVILER